MARVLVISFSDLAKDPRVHRQIEYLARTHTVVEMGLGPSAIPDVDFVPCGFREKGTIDRIRKGLRLLTHSYDAIYWDEIDYEAIAARIPGQRFDMVIANDIEALPLALRMKGTAKVVFDAHEYYPLQFEDQRGFHLLLGRYTDHLCRTYMPQADRMLTVCDGIADLYREEYGVDPVVVVNAAPYADLEPTPVDPERIRLIYHGHANPTRRIEWLIELAALLEDRFTIDLMLVPSDMEYFGRLEALVGKTGRVRIIPPVAMDEIVAATHGYDIGVFLSNPGNTNQLHALPNKFFEYIQARLMVAIGPSPEMARYVRSYGLGVVADEFTPAALASALNRLTTEEIRTCKFRSNDATRELAGEVALEVLSESIHALTT